MRLKICHTKNVQSCHPYKKLHQNGYTFEWFNFSNFIAYVLHFKIFKSKDMSSIYINLLLKHFVTFVIPIVIEMMLLCYK